MTRRPSISAALYLLLVFLSGALVGAFAYRLYMVRTVVSSTYISRTPEEYRHRYIQEMTGRLRLSPDQVTNLQRIMDETRQRYREVHEQYKPELKVIENEQYMKVRAMLNEAQRGEYEKMRAERENWRRRGRR